MLRTCKGILAESSGVLNSGNEFVIEASSDIALCRLEQSRTSALHDQNLAPSCLSKYLPSSGSRKIKIVIELKSESDYPGMYTILNEACSWLQNMQHLSLVIELHLFSGMERHSCILEPLMWLRNVNKITFEQSEHNHDKTLSINQTSAISSRPIPS